MAFPKETPDLTPVESILTIEGYYDLMKKFVVSSRSLTKPFRIFADVDGMIIPFAHTEEDARSFTGSAFVKTLDDVYTDDGYKIMENTGLVWWDKEVVEKFAELSRHPLIDVVWLTSWNSNAPYALDPLLNINSVGFLPWSLKMSDYNQVFKGVAIRELQKKYPSKFIWLDDKANTRRDAYRSHYFASFNDVDYDESGNKIFLTENPEIQSKWFAPEENEEFYEILESDYLSITTDRYVGLTLENIDEILEWVELQSK